MVVLTQHCPTGQEDSACLAHLVGSAVNQDGRSSSLTAPNGPAQQELVATALESGLLEPAAVGLVAVHGTGGATNRGGPCGGPC